MKRSGISVAVASIVIAVVVGIGVSAYYLGALGFVGEITTTTVAALPTASRSSTVSSSTETSAQTSAKQAANLQIVTGHVSHALSDVDVAATCGLAMPAQGASYLEVTNNGTAQAEVNTIVSSYEEMMTFSGAPTGACAVGIVATVYITLTGIGPDAATAGEQFFVALNGSNGGSATLGGAFA